MIHSERAETRINKENRTIRINKLILHMLGLQGTSELHAYIGWAKSDVPKQLFLSTLELSQGLAYWRLMIKNKQGMLSTITEQIADLGFSVERIGGFTLLDKAIAEFTLKLKPGDQVPLRTQANELEKRIEKLTVKYDGPVVSYSRAELISELIPETTFQNSYGKLDVEFESDAAVLRLDERLSESLGLQADKKYCTLSSVYVKIPLLVVRFCLLDSIAYTEAFLNEEVGSLNEFLQSAKTHFNLSSLDLSGSIDGKYFTRVYGKASTSIKDFESCIKCCPRLERESLKVVLMEE